MSEKSVEQRLTELEINQFRDVGEILNLCQEIIIVMRQYEEQIKKLEERVTKLEYKL